MAALGILRSMLASLAAMESWNLGLSINSLERRCIFSNSLSRSLQGILISCTLKPDSFIFAPGFSLSNLILSLSMEAVAALGGSSPPPIGPGPTGEVGVVAALLDTPAAASGLSLERLFLE